MWIWSCSPADTPLLEQGGLDELPTAVRAARRVGGQRRGVQLRVGGPRPSRPGRDVQLRARAARAARADRAGRADRRCLSSRANLPQRAVRRVRRQHTSRVACDPARRPAVEAHRSLRGGLAGARHGQTLPGLSRRPAGRGARSLRRGRRDLSRHLHGHPEHQRLGRRGDAPARRIRPASTTATNTHARPRGSTCTATGR